ncbi:MAG: sugar transferase [Clostridia bacterium]|nr:sugar transferase [Clostridia bacterium]
MYNRFFKRAIDIVLSFCGLLVLSPVYLVLFVAIRLDSKGSAFFVQRRVGIHKKQFNIYKFRTMYIDTPKNMPTHMLQGADSHITRIGKLLRKYSLDELPQIFNIFKGDMSIIGPRPALWNQYDLIDERDKYGANDIKPGLTGYAQINGRDELPIDVKAKMDGQYVKNMGFWVDVKLFFGTILSVIMHDGVVEGGVEENKKSDNVEV